MKAVVATFALKSDPKFTTSLCANSSAHCASRKSDDRHTARTPTRTMLIIFMQHKMLN